jgi:uncharacterized lipoprotein YmbA
VIAVPRWTATALAGVAMAALASGGCFRLARKSPPVERFVLGGVQIAPVEATSGWPDSLGLAIGMRRTDLAPYLATLAIVVRRADNEIVTSGFHRWAENPNAGVTRAVADYLAESPAIRSVDVAPWHIRAEQDYIVQLHVMRLEGVLTDARRGEGHVLARWEILRPHDGTLLARGATEHRAQGWTENDFLGLVSRLDEGLAAVARDLLGCFVRLRSAPPADANPLTCTQP